MAKIEIIGLMEELDRTLDFLQQTGVMQIDEIPTVDEKHRSHIHRIHLDETKEHLRAGYEELLATTSEILEIFGDVDVDNVPLDGETRERLQKLSPDDLLEQIAHISHDGRRLGRKQRNLEQDLESTQQYEVLINTFLPLLEKAGGAEEMEQLGIILKRGELSVVPVIEKRLREVTDSRMLFFSQKMTDGRIGIFIAVAPEYLPVVRQMLGIEGVAEYHIPREFRRKNFRESIEEIRIRIEEIPVEIAKIERQLTEMKKSSISLLGFIRSLSADRLNQLKILSRFVRTNYTFVISGWIPASSFDHLQHRLYDSFENRVYIGKVRLSDLDFLHIPTVLKNRSFFRSFELLTKLLPPPKYGNIDATPFVTFFFPVFFGIILGDIGYGLVLLGLAALIKWKMPRRSHISDAATVAVVAGISTVIFGIMFGEFFGDFGENIGIRPLAPWLHRVESVEVILLMAIGIGALHITLGFLLKTYLGIVMRHVKGVVEGISQIVIILGVFTIFIQVLLGFPLILRHGAYVMLAAGFLGIVFTAGFIGILEIFSIFGNILSYSRIMAIGLASAMLAMVANRLAEASHNIIAAILIAFMIHLVNFIMGVFSPTIHSLRLHYVEFFGKFFLPSGIPFQPFKKMREDHS